MIPGYQMNNPQAPVLPFAQPQQPQFNTQLQVLEQKSLTQIKDFLQLFCRISHCLELKTQIYQLNVTQQSCSHNLNNASSESELIRKESDHQLKKNVQEAIKIKYQVIKARNQKLLTRLLNLRQKISSQMYMHRISSVPAQTDLERTNEKIRHLRMQITNKYNQLRFHKFNSSKDNTLPKEQIGLASDLPLGELKKGAELLEKETMRLKSELNFVIRYNAGQKIDDL